MKNKIKSIVFYFVFIFLLFLLIYFCNIIYNDFIRELSFENYVINLSKENVSDLFTIDKIVLFSSSDAESVINSNNTITINNLSQYTDIAIFINNSETDFSLENTLKSVSIKNLTFNTSPNIGTPSLYYKGLNDFATSNFSEDNIITSDLDFIISSEDEIDYSQPILYNNCANPITLTYVNSDIKNDYTIANTDNSITYDGSLLKKCSVLLGDLMCEFSFTIYIENNLGDIFVCPIYISIPLENDSSSVYNGSYTSIYNPNYYFYKK